MNSVKKPGNLDATWGRGGIRERVIQRPAGA